MNTWINLLFTGGGIGAIVAAAFRYLRVGKTTEYKALKDACATLRQMLDRQQVEIETLKAEVKHNRSERHALADKMQQLMVEHALLKRDHEALKIENAALREELDSVRRSRSRPPPPAPPAPVPFE